MGENNSKLHITWYQGIATIVVLGKLVCFSACGKASIIKDTPTPMRTLLEDYADDTEIDDVLKDGTSLVYNDDSNVTSDSESYYELVCELDRILNNKEYINRIFDLDNVQKEKVPELSDAEKKTLLKDEESMSTVLIETYKKGLINKKELGLFYSKIKALDEFYDMWIGKNGLHIIDHALDDSIEVASCEALGIKPGIENSKVAFFDDSEVGTYVKFSTLIKEKGDVTSQRKYFDIPYEKNQLGVKALRAIQLAEKNKDTTIETKYDLCLEGNSNLKKLIKEGAKVKKKTLYYRR